MEVLAIIPARGGSKGVPGKNLTRVGGLSLIARTIGVVSKSSARVVVSTDHPVIDKIAGRHGADVMDQPSASDTSLPEDAERHVLDTLWKDERYRPDVIVRLFCTNPFTEPQDINACLAMIEKGAEAVVSVCEPSEWPSQVVKIKNDGTVKHVTRDWQKPRQAWKGRKIVNGAVYAARLSYWELHGGYFGPNTKAYEMPRSRSWDIDTEWDLEVARRLAE